MIALPPPVPVQCQVAAKNTFLTAADHTTVVLLGIAQLAANSVT